MADSPAVLYLRISLDRTNEELGVTRQREDCANLARLRGWDVVKTITDNDLSARKAGKRPGFAELLRDIEAGSVRVVVAWNFDRLLRNDREKLQLMELGQKHGIVISLVRGPELDLSTAAGRMMAGLLAEIARYEIELKSERHQSANLQKAQAGKPHASRRPFGYEMGYTAVRQDEAAIYREMVKRCLSGHSCRDIARWLNAQGHVTTQGKLWFPITVRNMLKSPRYIAIRDYKGVHYPGTWQPLISRDEWETVQLQLTSRRPVNAVGVNARKYLLTGKLVCGRCGVRLNGSKVQDRPTAPVRRIYICRSSSAKGLERGCFVRRNADALDAFVRDTVVYMLDTPDLAALLHGGSQDDDELKKLLQARDAQAARKDMLVTDYSTGLLDATEFARAKQAAKLELDRLDAEIDRHTAATAGSRLLSAGQTVGEAWEANGQDWRRRLLDLVHPGDIIVHPSTLKPFYEVDGQRYRFDQNAIEFQF